MIASIRNLRTRLIRCGLTGLVFVAIAVAEHLVTVFAIHEARTDAATFIATVFIVATKDGATFLGILALDHGTFGAGGDANATNVIATNVGTDAFRRPALGGGGVIVVRVHAHVINTGSYGAGWCEAVRLRTVGIDLAFQAGVDGGRIVRVAIVINVAAIVVVVVVTRFHRTGLVKWNA